MHNGGIGGWISTIKIFPDARAGVFVSTTNDVGAESNSNDQINLWLSDYVLGMFYNSNF